MANPHKVDRFKVAVLCLDQIQESDQPLSALELAGKIGISYPVVKQSLDLHGHQLGLSSSKKGKWGSQTLWDLDPVPQKKPRLNPPSCREENPPGRLLQEALERFRQEPPRYGGRRNA